MSATTAGLEGLHQAKNVTFLHQKTGEKVEALPADWPDHNWVYVYGPAGGINSNVLDMTKWLRLQLGKGKFNGPTHQRGQPGVSPHAENYPGNRPKQDGLLL